MAMEHRCGARKPLNLEVTIHCPRLGPVRAQARDISIGGMFVETATGFTVNEPVTIEFHSPLARVAHRWHAAIVHIASNGVGLMFDTFRSTELATLLHLLHVADERSRAPRLPVRPADWNTLVPQAGIDHLGVTPVGDARANSASLHFKLGSRA